MIKLLSISIKNILIKSTIVLVIFAFNGCKKGCTDPLAVNYDPNAKKENQSCQYESFNKQALLDNLVNSYILPSVSAYKTSIDNLHSSSTAFVASPSTSNLNSLRTSWETALLTWQDIAFLDFGPASYIVLKSQTNTYPADTSAINSNILSGNWTFTSANFNDQKGFQALDYLLNIPGLSDQQIVDYFSSTTNANSYLTDITQDLVTNGTYIYDQWNSSYKDDFINDFESNAQGSSVSDIVNALNLHYEYYIRRGKLGLPLGVFNGFSQQPMPELVECYYYGQSLPFTIRAVESLQKFINGCNYLIPEENNLGLDDYMDFTNAQQGGSPLSDVIDNQFAEIITALNGLNDPLSNEVVANNPQGLQAYDKLQQLVPLIKVDMTSALGVLITYQDNDGD
jgi:hypothetical protein